MPLFWYCLVVLCVCLLYICWINIVWGCVWVEANTQSNFKHAIVSWVNSAPINNRLLSTNAHRPWKCTNGVECVLELTWNIMKWHAYKNLQEYRIPVKHIEISVIFGLSAVLPGNEYHLIKTLFYKLWWNNREKNCIWTGCIPLLRIHISLWFVGS